jgi:glycosyltransferase involved in cell wall biosynthesis
MSHADFVARYSVPVVDANAPRPVLQWSRRGEGRARSIVGDLRVRLRGRRLAYIDSHFPWQRSGFRYADELALHEARPDTVFFSMYETRDPFPAPVLPLAQFPRLAASLGVTDVYGVFLNFMAGILGLGRGEAAEPGPTEGLDLSRVLRSQGIRVHAGLFPGGGFVPTDAGFAAARQLVQAADTVVSWVPTVLEHVPGVAAIAPAMIDTAYYAAVPHDFQARPLQLLFAADAKPRKGLAVALGAVAQLAGEPVHLHVVGPHDPSSWDGPPGLVTFHGWLDRGQLRDLHRRCHVFLSPVRTEQPGEPGGDGGVTDGFPTAGAGEAASSGCLLVTANPEADRRALRPGIDHIEPAATAAAFAEAVRWALAEPGHAAAIAQSGSRRVRERLDVRVGAAERIRVMGLG